MDIFNRTFEENIRIYGSFRELFETIEKIYPSDDWERLCKEYEDSLHSGNGEAEEALERCYFYYKKKRFV